MKYLDFHLVVGRVADADHLVTAVFDAPVTREGSPFSWLGGRRTTLGKLLATGSLQGSPLCLKLDSSGNYYLEATAPLDGGGQPPAGLASALFELLFPEGSATRVLLARSCERARTEGNELRILLELPSELVNLPWEIMLPPLRGDWAVVLNQTRWCVQRYFGDIRRPTPAPPVERPVALVVKADPQEYSTPELTRSLYRERDRLKSTLQGRMACEVVEDRDTWNNLRNTVNRLADSGQQVWSLHFMGHGGVDEQGGYLVGEDCDGRATRIYGRQLMDVLDRTRSLQLVILNACSTAHQPVGCPLSGLATSVSMLGDVPTVVAYLRPVDTTDAEALAATFYEDVLVRRRPIDEIVRSLQLKQHLDAGTGGLVVLRRAVEDEEDRVPRVAPLPPTPSQAAEPPRVVRGPGNLAPSVRVPAGPFQKGLRPDQLDRLLQQFERHGLPISVEDARAALTEERLETVVLPEFSIDQAPVTNEQFRRFVEDTRHRTTAELAGDPHNWRINDVAEKRDHPVVLVSYHDAVAFAHWAQKRLPTADEWKKAYRGEKGNLYPWGDDEFEAKRCNTGENVSVRNTSPVTLFEATSRSAYGCLDMIGNVEEWTSTPGRGGNLVILGGSWAMSCEVYGLPVLSRLASPDYYAKDQGFRCAKDP